MERVRVEQGGRAYRALHILWDEDAGPVLREYVDDPDPMVALLAIRALGGCGSAADGPRLLALARAARTPELLDTLLDTLTELDVVEVVPLLHELLDGWHVGSSSEASVLKRLVWLRDPSVADRLLDLVRGDTPRFVDLDPIAGILELGTGAHRGELVDIAVDAARRVVATDERPPVAWFDSDRDHQRWLGFCSAASAVGAPELADAYRRVDASPEAQDRGLVLTPSQTQQQRVATRADRVVPSVWLRPSSGPAQDLWPPPKFLGQPDWRDEPAWPLSPSGDPMMFYGQLPLPDARTAYIFLARDGDQEWEPLGGDNAVVVQPGNLCDAPTVALSHGPQEQTWSPPSGFRSRTRLLPHPERFVDLVPALDPVIWESLDESAWEADDASTWDKLGGTPRWLQGEESPPGDGWAFVAQFGAESLASERGDGAICYLWQHADGRAAFGWQCH